MVMLERLQKIYGDDEGKKLEKDIKSLLQYYNNYIDEKDKRMSLWNQEDIMLITYGDQFHNNNVPTLQTFRDMFIEWFSDLFSATHFLPFFPYTSDDGFSVVNYKHIDPAMGDWNDVRSILKYSDIMVDFVCNHTSKSSLYFQGYLNNDPTYENFFVSVDPNRDLSSVTRPRSTPLLTPFVFSDGEIRNVWTTFSDDQVDLNYANPDVLLWAIDILLFYVSQGARYIRLDAVGFMWKEIGTSSIHLWQTHEIIKVFREVIERTNTETKIITETNVPHKDNISYFGNGYDEAHMVYQFPLPPLMLLSIKEENAEEMTKWAQTLSLPSEKTSFFNFLASHDGIGLNPLRGLVEEERILELVEKVRENGGLISYKTNYDGTKSPYELNISYIDALSNKKDSIDTKVQKMALAHSILLCLKGLPALYVQSIIGGTNDLKGVERIGQNRSINRKKYDYIEIQEELLEEGSLKNKVYNRLSQMIKERKKQIVFHPDAQMEILNIKPELFVIKREAKNEKIISINNVSEKTITFSLDEIEIKKGTELFGKENCTDGKVILQPFEFLWIKENIINQY